MTQTSYEQFYARKALPSTEQEGAIQVLQFDGKGVPMIKREAMKLKARAGKREKRQKKKEAMVGVSYTVDRHERRAEEVAENLIYPEQYKKCPSPILGEGHHYCALNFIYTLSSIHIPK